MRYALALLAALAWTAAIAHEAPSGWEYGGDCCSDRDCRPAKSGEVTFQACGWYVETTGECYAEGDSHLRQSGDQLVHVCINERAMLYGYAPTPQAKHVVCIYLPKGKF